MCGSRLVLRDDGLTCGSDPAHAGQVLAARPSEAFILARLQRGGPMPDMPPHQAQRVTYLLLRYHAWGRHDLCRWLPALGVRPSGCDQPEPARTEASLW